MGIFILSFFLLRSYQLQNSGMLYAGDDYSYLAHSTSIVFGEFPSYDKEYYEIGNKRPLHSIGSGLMAVPFVYAFSWMDRLAGADVVKERTRESLRHSWTAFGFLLASYSYFILACLLLYRGLSYFFSKNISLYSTVLACLFQGMPLYVMRRPFFAHSFEFFLSAVLIFILLYKEKQGKYSPSGILEIALLFAVLILVPEVRRNNLFVLFVWPFVLWGIVNKGTSAKKILSIMLGAIIAFGCVVAAFKYSLFLRSLLQEDSNYVFSFLRLNSMDVYIHRLIQVFVGIDWGLLWTAPFLLLGIYGITRYSFSLKKQLWLCMIPVLFNIVIIVHFNSVHQGSYYGYRYFFPSAIPVLLYPFALLCEKASKKHGIKFWLFILILSTISLLSMLSFEGNNTNLTLHAKSVGGWWNETYQLQVWRTLILHPQKWVIAILKGGPLYCVYLLANSVGKSALLPEIVRTKYPSFNSLVLLKVGILYSLPLLWAGILAKFRKSISKSN